MFVKGQISNPTGKNWKKPVTEALKAILSRPASDKLDDEPKNLAQAIALKLAREALYGKDFLPISKEIMDRVEGKPTQSFANDEDNPLFPVNKEDDHTILDHFFKSRKTT